MGLTASYQNKNGIRKSPFKTLLIMRLTIALLLFFIVKADAKGYGQKINIIRKHVALTEIFNAITQQTGFLFFYDKTLIEKIEPIDITLSDATLEEALSVCLKDRHLTYTIVRNTIVIQSKITVTNSTYKELDTRTIPPPVEIHGKVANQKGEPLVGVSITVKGTNIGTSTDGKGNYSITASQDAVLLFSNVGYTKKEIAVNNRLEVNVVMEVTLSALDQVVVIGYGTSTRAKLTGAVSTVDVGKVMSSRPSTNVASLLEGEVAGAFIHQNSGQPGAEGMEITVRGTGSMGNSAPLVIIDGMESSMDNINPFDIENISVLKDAASASIYGTRAANGVILITTKRGKEGPVQIKYNAYFGLQKATDVPDFLGSADYAVLYNEARTNAGLTPTYSDADIAKYKAGNDPNYPSTDWMSVLYSGSGLAQFHNLDLSGGNEKTRYNISMAYKQQDGVIQQVNAKQGNLRVNLDSKLNRWLSVGINSAMSYAVNTIPLTGPELTRGGDLQQFYNSVTHVLPIYPVKLPDGSWSGLYPLGNLAAWIAEGNLRTTPVSHLVQTMFSDAKITEGLNWRNRASVDYTSSDITNHISNFTYGGGQVSGPASNQEEVDKLLIIDFESLLTYEKRIGKHAINVLLGTSTRSEAFNMLMGYRLGFPSNDLTALNAGSTTGLTNAGSDTRATLSSYFGRINYDYNGKYLFEADLRRDGSSKFAAAKRWGWFPSFSAGWIVTKENFLKDVKWLNFLKLRASWGQLGNDRIADYLYQPLISLGQNYPFGGVSATGGAQTVANNPNITWETTTERNFGVDLKFFQNAFSVTIDAYNRYTEHILTGVPVSAAFGLPAPTVNSGAMSNKGLETELKYSKLKGKFQFDISFNGSYNRNRVEAYNGTDIFDVAGEGGAIVREKGIPWNSYIGYQWIGYFSSDAEAHGSAVQNPNVGAGDLRFKDQNGDGVIDGKDRVILGSINPKYTYGMNLGVRYKRFDFGTFFQGVQDVQWYIRVRGYFPFMRNGKALRMNLDREIVQNGKVVKQGYFPETQLEGGAGGKNVVSSGFTIHNASYLRMKHLQIGYTLPDQWLKAVGISKFRIYASGENLLTFTKFPSGYDPEVNTTPFHGHVVGGAAGWSYPQVKFYVFGLEVGF